MKRLKVRDGGMTIATMKRAFVAGIVFLFAFLPRASFAAATCSTFDARDRPAANFAAFDKIIVRANGMQAHAPALVTFSQGTRTVQLASTKTNDLGAFATDPNKTRLPASVDEGRAKIKVLQGAATASCDVIMVAATDSKPGGFSRTFYLTWGIVLALLAIALAIAQVRRWQAEKLEKEMDRIEWRHPKDEIVDAIPQTDDDDEDLDDEPLEIVELDPPEATQSIVLTEEGLSDQDGPDEEDGDDRPFLEFEPPAEPDEPEPQPEPVVRPASPPRKRVRETVKSEPSDAITKLQQEVRSWRTR